MSIQDIHLIDYPRKWKQSLSETVRLDDDDEEECKKYGPKEVYKKNITIQPKIVIIPKVPEDLKGKKFVVENKTKVRLKFTEFVDFGREEKTMLKEIHEFEKPFTYDSYLVKRKVFRKIDNNWVLQNDIVNNFQGSKKVNVEEIDLEGIPIDDLTKKAKKE